MYLRCNPDLNDRVVGLRRIDRATEELFEAFGVTESPGVEVQTGVIEDRLACGLPVFTEGAIRIGHDGVDGDGGLVARGVGVFVVEFFILPSRIGVLDESGEEGDEVISELLCRHGLVSCRYAEGFPDKKRTYC